MLWWLIWCQLDWATGCPDFLSNVILCLWGLLSLLFFEINIWFTRQNKRDYPLWIGCSSSNPLKTWIEQNALVGGNLPLPDCLLVGTLSSPAFLFRLDWNYPISFPGSPACQCRLQDFSASIITWANFL